MTSELSFLLDLLLNQRMPLATKELVAARIKEVEQHLSSVPMMVRMNTAPMVQAVPKQAASTQAILDRNPDLQAALIPPEMPPIPPMPVAQIAQTPLAMAAMASRNQAINESLAGKVNKETGRPRKF